MITGWLSYPVGDESLFVWSVVYGITILKWLRRPPAWKSEPLRFTEPEDYGNDEACLWWGNYQPFRVPSCLVVGMRGWWARGGTLLKRQHEVQGVGNPQGTATHTRGRMPLRQLLVPQGTDTPEGMMDHVRAEDGSLHHWGTKAAGKPLNLTWQKIPSHPSTSFATRCLLNLRSLAGLSVTHSKTKRNWA